MNQHSVDLKKADTALAKIFKKKKNVSSATNVSQYTLKQLK